MSDELVGHIATRKTSALKSIVWRMIGVGILATVTYYFTRHLLVTTKITITHHLFFLVVFYTYERIWTHLRRLRPPLRNIVKALFYEIILGMGLGGIIVFAYTGSLSVVSSVTTTYTVCKMILYVPFDWLWPERF
jgi:uncharacterized membrane protein